MYCTTKKKLSTQTYTVRNTNRSPSKVQIQTERSKELKQEQIWEARNQLNSKPKFSGHLSHLSHLRQNTRKRLGKKKMQAAPEGQLGAGQCYWFLKY